MDTNETAVIRLLEKLKKEQKVFDLDHYIDVHENLVYMTRRPLGQMSHDFISNPLYEEALIKLIEIEPTVDFLQKLLLRLRLEQYIQSEIKTDKMYENIGQALELCVAEYRRTLKDSGMSMLPEHLTNQDFRQEILSLKDHRLNSIFHKYLPKVLYLDKVKESKESVEKFVRRSGKRLSEVESDVMKIQRMWRAKKRVREDLVRVAKNFGITDAETRELLRNASQPYQPHCDPDLANRLMTLSKDIKLFSEVHHHTASSAITSIFDDALFGQKSLLAHGMKFKESALSSADVVEGDANVVCLGAQGVDYGLYQDMELDFDAEKISKDNPCVFYKQRDLHYVLAEKQRKVKIGDFDLVFGHTKMLQGSFAPFEVYEPNTWKVIGSSTVKSSSLVSYNVEDMHQILILNFFRFLDGLDNQEYRDKVYSELSKLDDDALRKTLYEIGKNASDTMEFNFYGAYKIDFAALKSMTATAVVREGSKLPQPYTLDIEDFIKELNGGNQKLLTEASEIFPGAFKSYRFVDYLISKVKNEQINQSLQDIRAECAGPHFDVS